MNSDGFGILIIDDEPNIRSGLAKGLAREADILETAQNAEEGLAKFRAGFFQLVIADVRLPGEMDGLELIDQILHIRPQNNGDCHYGTRYRGNSGEIHASGGV